MDINKLMQQAQEMQKQLEKANDQINEMEFEGTASNGLVKIAINGENRVLAVSIDKEVINPDDKDMLEDMIMIAINDAIQQVEETKKDKFGGMAAAMGLPIR